MPSIEKIREKILQIAARKKNTTVEEIDWVIKQLGQNGFKVRERETRHSVLYVVEPVRFSVCTHNRGSKQLKSCYVEGFLNAMIEIGLYEE